MLSGEDGNNDWWSIFTSEVVVLLDSSTDGAGGIRTNLEHVFGAVTDNFAPHGQEVGKKPFDGDDSLIPDNFAWDEFSWCILDHVGEESPDLTELSHILGPVGEILPVNILDEFLGMVNNDWDFVVALTPVWGFLFSEESSNESFSNFDGVSIGETPEAEDWLLFGLNLSWNISDEYSSHGDKGCLEHYSLFIIYYYYK